MKSFKSVLQHMNKSKTCKSQCTNEQIEQIQKETKLKRTEKKKEENKKCKERARSRNLGAVRISKRLENRKYRAKQNPKVLKEYNRNTQIKSRISDSPDKRLKNFLVATLHNAVFICISCHQRCFKSNVVEYTQKVKDSISSG